MKFSNDTSIRITKRLCCPDLEDQKLLDALAMTKQTFEMCTPRLRWMPEHCMHTNIPKLTLAHLGPLQRPCKTFIRCSKVHVEWACISAINHWVTTSALFNKVESNLSSLLIKDVHGFTNPRHLAIQLIDPPRSYIKQWQCQNFHLNNINDFVKMLSKYMKDDWWN